MLISAALPNNKIKLVDRFSHHVGYKTRLHKSLGTEFVHEFLSADEIFHQSVQIFNEAIALYSKTPTHIITVTQTPPSCIPSYSSSICYKSNVENLEDIIRFDLTSGCTGYVDALRLASYILEQHEDPLVFICTLEALRANISADDIALNLLFGDAITLSCFDYSDKNSLSKFATTSSFRGKSPIYFDEERRLKLIGSDVYESALTLVPDHLETNISEDSPRTLLLHQANQLLNTSISSKFSGIHAPSNIASYGNTSSCSIPLLIYDNVNLISQGAILCGFGVGFTVNSCVLTPVQLSRF